MTSTPSFLPVVGRWCCCGCLCPPLGGAGIVTSGGMVVVGVTWVLIAFFSTAWATNLPIKIVKEPVSYGLFGNHYAQEDHTNQLVARVKPANFSGPSQFRNVIGRCFNHSSGDYRYVLCPFQNISQFETSFRWNAYKGILGIWQGWRIENGSFVSMIFGMGDKCGLKDRSAEVQLKCGSQHQLSNMTEPEKCQYHAIFTTPLVCHRDALLVYPRMSPELRAKWADIESDYFNEVLTEKGYKLQLEKLFEEAGFIYRFQSSESQSSVPTEKPASDGHFTDLGQCNAAYLQIKQELEQLRRHSSIKEPTTTPIARRPTN